MTEEGESDIKTSLDGVELLESKQESVIIFQVRILFRNKVS